MSNNYDISIVTPFHNVDMEVFKAGIESMKMQTYGFDNIQWIVVVHNSESEYKKAVHEMLDSYENVIVKELDNDRRTPSSPRNYGISLATGNYIGFLDGDDSFTYDCIETVLEVIQRNKAQVVSFRREFELENDNDVPVTEIVLWDQIEKEIVIDKNNWDDVKMFSGVCGMVTSRVYDRKFLEENKLKFDESVLFGEDFLFNMEVYGRLERVVYLPQFIGYHYYINRGSLVQSGEKSPETLIAYAKGYTKIFDAGLKYGFYMNAIISRLCVVLSRFLVQSKSITIEQRKEIRDILEPYISKTTEITPSKVYPVKVVKELYEIPRKVILNPEEWVKSNEGGLLVSNQEDIDAFNDKMTQTLSHILEKNQNTDMGKHYKFWDIMTVNDYRNHVPLSDYSDLEPLIKLTTRIGESDIFTAEEIDSYVTKENEAGKIDGKMRVFPITRRMVRGNARSFSRLIENRRCVILPDKPKGGIVRYNDAVYANTLERAILQELYSNRPGIVRPDVTSPQDLFFNDVNYDTRYLHLLFALRDADVAEESSNYIKAQILQQASATLLATANQTPSIALNLL